MQEPVKAPFDRLLVIAEAGMGHDGSFGNAGRLVDMSADCGADAVKFQLHIPAAETLRSAPAPAFFTAEPRWEYFERTAFSDAQWKALAARCAERKTAFWCSPFSEEAVDRLLGLGVQGFKIASGEVSNTPLLERVAAAGKPVVLSSGMSTWAELDRAVEVLKRSGVPLAVLQCTSAYPCPPEQVGLNVMLEMTARYGLPVGLSDHTLGAGASIAAVALGARVIERHVTFSRLMYGSDPQHSLEPAEFKRLCAELRDAERAVSAPVDKDAMARGLAAMKRTFEKSLVALKDLPAGSAVTREGVGAKKPGDGIPAARLGELLGRRLRRAVAKDTQLSEEDLTP